MDRASGKIVHWRDVGTRDAGGRGAVPAQKLDAVVLAILIKSGVRRFIQLQLLDHL